MKKISLLIFCFLFLFSKDEITLEFLQSKPEGVARDFYIWRFLQDPKISLQDALQAYALIFRKNDKIEKLMIQKGHLQELPQDIRCKKLPFEKLKNENAQCISFGLKLSLIPSLSPQDIQSLVTTLSTSNPILAEEIQILSSKSPIIGAIKSQNAQIFGEIFFGLTLEQRLAFFNQRIKIKHIEKFGNQNNPTFNKMIQYVLLSESFNELKHSLLKANITQADEKILFLLGIAQLQAKNKQKAQKYFKLTLDQAKSPLIKDKALFWIYLTSKNPQFLKQLAKSTNLNLYTIYATQTLKIKPQYTIVSQIQNTQKGKTTFNITDPFEWQILKNNLFKIQAGEELKPILDKYLTYPDSQPHLAFMLNRMEKFRNNYFLMPYASSISWKDIHQKALTYAIARQESHLIPALVSTSYALGMMQIMPFNLNPIAKALNKKEVTLDDLFNPQIALEFGRFYLAELESEFKHPLFVAYAYNGGPGFLRRTLKKGNLFVQGQPYEPWISLELIPYEESKNYGPLVLTNYIIYQELLGNKLNLKKLLSQTLIYKKEKK